MVLMWSCIGSAPGDSAVERWRDWEGRFFKILFHPKYKGTTTTRQDSGDVIGFPLTHEVYHMERTGEGILKMMMTTRTTRKKLIDAFDLKLLRVTNQRVFGS